MADETNPEKAFQPLTTGEILGINYDLEAWQLNMNIVDSLSLRIEELVLVLWRRNRRCLWEKLRRFSGR